MRIGRSMQHMLKVLIAESLCACIAGRCAEEGEAADPTRAVRRRRRMQRSPLPQPKKELRELGPKPTARRRPSTPEARIAAGAEETRRATEEEPRAGARQAAPPSSRPGRCASLRPRRRRGSPPRPPQGGTRVMLVTQRLADSDAGQMHVGAPRLRLHAGRGAQGKRRRERQFPQPFLEACRTVHEAGCRVDAGAGDDGSGMGSEAGE
ncbi:unnamed protein product [Prorocentrum cordatum]|uniref:Uncharacterized protein n=1 Tax=Prorocentrum cordatum TaxID=2364126 RepID=A0ABN9S014_9DINO|nr:unnamed protein product [Polarella glacialis]